MLLNLRLIFTFLAMIIIPMFFIGMISVNNAREELSRSVLHKLSEVAISKEAHVEAVIKQNQERVFSITTRTELQNMLGEYSNNRNADVRLNIERILAEARNAIDDIHEISIASTNGTILISTNDAREGINVKDEEYYVRAVADDMPYVSEITLDELGHPHAYLSGKIKLQNSILGVLIAESNAKDITSITSDYVSLGSTGEALIVRRDDDDNVVTVTPTRSHLAIVGQKLADSFDLDAPSMIALTSEQSRLKQALDYRGQRVFAVTRYIENQDWAIVVKINRTEALKPIAQLQVTLMTIMIIVTMFSGIVAYVVSRSISKPIGTLTSATKKIAKGNLDAPINPELLSSKDEIGQLAQSFYIMTVKLQESHFGLQQKIRDKTKELTDNLAHTEKQNKILKKTKEDLLVAIRDTENEKERFQKQVLETKKFEQAVGSATDGVIITALNGEIIYVNAAWEEMTGYTLTEVKGGNPNILKSEKTEISVFKDMWHELEENNHFFTEEIFNTRKDGNEFQAQLSIYPIQENDKTVYFVGLMQDITLRKNIDQAKSEFVSLASHQLRTPLSTINWYSEMLVAGDAGKLSAEQLDYMKEIHIGNQRMIELVNALLNVSRIELGTLAIDPEPVSLAEVADSIIGEIAPQTAMKGITIEKEYDKNVPDIQLDSKLIRIVFQNLLTNAVKYSPDDTIVHIGIKLRKKDVLITVTDEGYGIPQNQQKRIFSKLFRADNARDKETDGTGLGLYIAKSVIEEGGGKIWFESIENKGTTFSCTVPLEGVKKRDGSRGLESEKSFS